MTLLAAEARTVLFFVIIIVAVEAVKQQSAASNTRSLCSGTICECVCSMGTCLFRESGFCRSSFFAFLSIAACARRVIPDGYLLEEKGWVKGGRVSAEQCDASYELLELLVLGTLFGAIRLPCEYCSYKAKTKYFLRGSLRALRGCDVDTRLSFCCFRDVHVWNEASVCLFEREWVYPVGCGV